MIDRMKKSVSLAIAMLIVMATIAVPVAMAKTNTGIGAASGAGCGTCGTQNVNGSGCGAGTNLTFIELNGSEKNKAIAEALKNEKVKELRDQLLDKGYTPETDDSKAAIITDKTNVSSKEIIGVRLPFKFNESERLEVVFAYDPITGDSAAIIAHSAWDCAACALGIAGCIACAIPCSAGPNPACIICLVTACPVAYIDCCKCVGCAWPCASGICG